RRDCSCISNQPPADQQCQKKRDSEEEPEQKNLLRLEQNLNGQTALLVDQQWNDGTDDQSQHSAQKTAENNGQQQSPSHGLSRHAAQAHQSEFATLIQHQKPGKICCEHPCHP